MVFRDDGHGHRRRVNGIGAISYSGPPLSLYSLFLAECGALWSGISYLGPAILPVPGDLASHDPGPHQFIVYGDGTHGLCDFDRDVDFYLCAAMGPVGYNCSLGAVDNRCRCGGSGYTLSILHFVGLLNLALGVICADFGFIRISQRHITSLDRITAIQLLPIAATIVAAGVGARVADILPNESHALGTLLVSFILWGMGTPLALVVLVMYYQRLAVHKLPPREMIVSCFLPLGPLGFGGFG